MSYRQQQVVWSASVSAFSSNVKQDVIINDSPPTIDYPIVYDELFTDMHLSPSLRNRKKPRSRKSSMEGESVPANDEIGIQPRLSMRRNDESTSPVATKTRKRMKSARKVRAKDAEDSALSDIVSNRPRIRSTSSNIESQRSRLVSFSDDVTVEGLSRSGDVLSDNVGNRLRTRTTSSNIESQQRSRFVSFNDDVTDDGVHQSSRRRTRSDQNQDSDDAASDNLSYFSYLSNESSNRPSRRAFGSASSMNSFWTLSHSNLPSLNPSRTHSRHGSERSVPQVYFESSVGRDESDDGDNNDSYSNYSLSGTSNYDLERSSSDSEDDDEEGDSMWSLELSDDELDQEIQIIL